MYPLNSYSITSGIDFTYELSGSPFAMDLLYSRLTQLANGVKTQVCLTVKAEKE